MFSWYKYLIINLVFSYLGFWSGNLFQIAPFPDLCLFVPLNVSGQKVKFQNAEMGILADCLCLDRG